jgi:hypothetical protein
MSLATLLAGLGGELGDPRITLGFLVYLRVPCTVPGWSRSAHLGTEAGVAAALVGAGLERRLRPVPDT